jgi:predicted metalloendopeptidase
LAQERLIRAADLNSTLEGELKDTRRALDEATVEGAKFDELNETVEKQRLELTKAYSAQAASNATTLATTQTLYTLTMGLQKIAEHAAEMMSKRNDESSIPG